VKVLIKFIGFLIKSYIFLRYLFRLGYIFIETRGIHYILVPIFPPITICNAPKKKKKKSDEEEDKSGMDDVFGKLDEL